MAETWTHPSMSGLVVHPASFQDLQRIQRAFPAIVSPMEKASLAWEVSEDEAVHPPVGFPMMPGLVTANPFDLAVHPWIGTFPLHAMGRGDTGVAHQVPAFVVQVAFRWKLLQVWTTGPLPGSLYDFTLGAVDALWTARAVQANEAVQTYLNVGIQST